MCRQNGSPPTSPPLQRWVADDEVCRLGLVAVRQLIEFDVPINEVHHRSSTVSTQIELLILEIVISELVISYTGAA